MTDVRPPMSFAEVFRLHARARPHKVALVHGARSFTYRALDRMIDGACHAFAAQGITRGGLVGVALADTPGHIVALLALARMGAVILPMDCRWSQHEKASVFGHFLARFALVEPDDPAPSAQWLQVEPAWFAESDAPYVDDEVTAESPLLLSLSSGTTGMPKGPRVLHRQFESRFMVYWIDLGFGSGDRYISATPLYFGGGRGFTLAMLFAGATVHLYPPPYRPEELIAYVNAVAGTTLFLVPTLLRRLLEVEPDGLAFPTVRTLISSGSALYVEERHAIRRRLTPNLYELYASTEAGSISVLTPQDVEAYPDSVGRACFRVAFEVVDSEHRPLPAGEIGRLRYRSPSSPLRYHQGDGAEAFHDGWFYPGDLAMVNPDGYLYLRGRAKDMIIRGGVNIYPADIETVLLGMNGVTDASVVGIPAGALGEEVAAFVVLARPLEPAALIAHCREKLAAYKVPAHIRVVEALPRNSAGKVLKAELVRAFSAT